MKDGTRKTEAMASAKTKNEAIDHVDFTRIRLTPATPISYGRNLEPSPLFRLPIGARLFDRYVLINQLWSGCEHSRYSAYDDGHHLNVILTVVRTGPPTSDAQSHPLYLAAQRLRRMTDTGHVLRILDIQSGHFDGLDLLCVSQEVADGDSLLYWLPHKGADDVDLGKEVTSIFHEMAMGVAAMHEAGIFGLSLSLLDFSFCNGALKYDGLTTIPPIAQRLRVRDKSFDLPGLGSAFEQVLDQIRVGAVRHRISETSATFDTPPAVSRHLRRVIERCRAIDPTVQFFDARAVVRALEDKSMAWDEEDCAARDSARRDIESTMALGELDSARRACKRFLRNWPSDEGALALQAQLQKRFTDAEIVYQQIESEIGAGALGRTVDLLQQAVHLYPDHPAGISAQMRLGSLVREFQNCMKSGFDSLRRGSWDSALHCFQRAQVLDQGSPPAMTALAFVMDILGRIRTGRGEIDDAIHRQDKATALAHARALDTYIDSVLGTIREPGFRNDDH